MHGGDPGCGRGVRLLQDGGRSAGHRRRRTPVSRRDPGGRRAGARPRCRERRLRVDRTGRSVRAGPRRIRGRYPFERDRPRNGDAPCRCRDLPASPDVLRPPAPEDRQRHAGARRAGADGVGAGRRHGRQLAPGPRGSAAPARRDARDRHAHRSGPHLACRMAARRRRAPPCRADASGGGGDLLVRPREPPDAPAGERRDPAAGRHAERDARSGPDVGGARAPLRRRRQPRASDPVIDPESGAGARPGSSSHTR